MRVRRTGCIRPNGYLAYHKDNKNQMYHRKVWEQYNGPIPEGYHIHHIDGNKLNNNIENLQLVDPKTHKRIHTGYQLIDGIIWKPCKMCGKLKQLERDFNTQKNGYASWCISCKKEYRRKYNREYRKKYNQDDKNKIKLEQSEYYYKHKDHIAQMQRDRNNKKKIIKEAWKAFDYINNKEAIDKENNQHEIKRKLKRMEYYKQYYINNKAEKEALKNV